MRGPLGLFLFLNNKINQTIIISARSFGSVPAVLWANVNYRHILSLGHGGALLLREVLTVDPGHRDGLVHTGLDGLGVDHIHSRLDNSQDRHIVAGFLGDLLAVVVAIAVVSIAGGGLADSHHLGVALFLKGTLDSLGGGGLSLGLVGVGAHFVVDLLSALKVLLGGVRGGGGSVSDKSSVGWW